MGDLFEQCYHSEVCPGQCQTIYQRKHIFILSEERFSNFHLLGSGYNLFNYKKIVDLIVVLHQLDDHPDVVAVVLDRDDPHDIGRVLRKR